MVAVEVGQVDEINIVGSQIDCLQPRHQPAVVLSVTRVEQNVFAVFLQYEHAYGGRYAVLQAQAVNQCVAGIGKQGPFHEAFLCIVLNPRHFHAVGFNRFHSFHRCFFVFTHCRFCFF